MKPPERKKDLIASASPPQIPAYESSYPAASESFRMVVQKTDSGLAEGRHANTPAEIELSLIDPEGNTILSVPGLSGGWGRGELPGLSEDIDRNPHNSTFATYALQNLQQNLDIVPFAAPFQFDRGQGFFMRLISPPYTDRGIHRENLEKRGAFAIHPDGNSGIGVNDGSMGCIAVNTHHSEAFAEAWNQIPKGKRPNHLEVLPPAATRVASMIPSPPHETESPAPPIADANRAYGETPSQSVQATSDDPAQGKSGRRIPL